MPKPYRIICSCGHEREANADEVIALAKKKGYKGYNGMFFMSEAKRILWGEGYTVWPNQNYAG